MPSTTLETVRTAAPFLSGVGDTSIALFLADAALEVQALNPPEEYRERLERYLVIHFASMESNRVVKEKMDIFEKTYATSSGSGILSTPFGEEFERLVNELGLRKKKSGLNLTVL